MKPFNIIVDSSCDLDAYDAVKFGVQILDFELSKVDQEFIDHDGKMKYLENEDILLKNLPAMRQNIYEMTKEHEHLKSHSLSSSSANTLYNRLFDPESDTLFLCLSSSMSGTIENIRPTFETMKISTNNSNHFLFDTLSASGGIRLLLDQALLARSKGKTAKETFEYLSRVRARETTVFFTTDNFYFCYNGRMKTEIKTNDILSTSVFGTISDEGKCEYLFSEHGMKKSIDSLVAFVQNNIDKSKHVPVYISYGANIQDATILEKKLKDQMPELVVTKNEVSPVIAVNTGEKILGITFISKDRKTVSEKTSN